MRINDDVKKGVSFAKKESQFAQHVAAVGSESKSFVRLVDAQLSRDFQKEVTQFVSALDRIRDALKVRLSVENLLMYKSQIQGLLRFVCKHAYCVRKIHGRRLNHKLLSVLHERLEELAHKIIHEEAAHMRLIEELDEIRGLIIDLLF